MIRVDQERDTEIRNRLNYFADDIYKDNISKSDSYWAHNTINDLLLDIYLLQEELARRKKANDRESRPQTRQPTSIDICDMSS